MLTWDQPGSESRETRKPVTTARETNSLKKERGRDMFAVPLALVHGEMLGNHQPWLQLSGDTKKSRAKVNRISLGHSRYLCSQNVVCSRHGVHESKVGGGRSWAFCLRRNGCGFHRHSSLTSTSRRLFLFDGNRRPFPGGRVTS